MAAYPKPDVPDDDPGNGMAYSVFPTCAWQDGRLLGTSDCVADEVPLALEYNGISHAVMLVSPTSLEDMATGFSLTEGIVSGIGDIQDIEIVASEQGLTARLRISARCFFRLKERRRSLTGRTGCGLCGAESLDQVYRQPAPVTSRNRFSAQSLQRAFAALRASQVLMQKTGATHAAAWMDGSGQIGTVREDVGRHNALDKLIGALTRAGTPTADGVALVTSRASYEMVLKSAAAGIGCLAAISAPTSLAIRLAESAQLTLAGFVREQRMVIYTHADRFEPDSGDSERS